MSNFVEIYFKDNKNNSHFVDEVIEVRKDCFLDKPQFRIDLKQNYDIYGLGETPGSLIRNRKDCMFYNTDNAGHKDGYPMYKHLPIIMLYPNDDNNLESIYLLWTNSQKMLEVYCQDFQIYIKCYSSEGFNLKIIKNYNIEELYSEYFKIEGHPFKTPLWSLGFHQSKYSYYSLGEINTIINQFKELQIPVESIWLDIDYMIDYKVFTVDFKKYGKLKNFIKDKRIVTILDPAIKIGYNVESDGSEKDIWIKDKEGNNLEVEVWAGKSYLPDYTMLKCREWWANKVSHFVNRYNVSGLWIDMNEPSLLNSDSTNPDPYAIHRADEDLGGTGMHQDYHNSYGYLMSKATYEGLIVARPNKRPFILTRSTKIGGQTYAAVWTGDNNSSWEHLHESIRMCLNLSLSGIPFCGVDVGGFLENTNDKLFSRWMGIGAWLPFFRNHTNNFTRPQEIWSFSNHTIEICKEAIYRRYRIMRYLYTQMILCSMQGTIFMKPIFWDKSINYSQIKEFGLLETSFLVGDLLIVCQTNEILDEKKNIDIGSYKKLVWKNDFPELPKVYLKKGRLFYKNSQLETTDNLQNDYNLSIIINKDDNNFAESYFYFDDGDGVMDDFWFGKIVYKNGNLIFYHLDGTRKLPKFDTKLIFV